MNIGPRRLDKFVNSLKRSVLGVTSAVTSATNAVVVVVVESDTPPAGPPGERPQAFLGGGPQGRICWNDPFLLASS